MDQDSGTYSAVIYEIWCAGISPNILGPIEEQQMDIWSSLLQASYGWKELCKTPQMMVNLRRSATPSAARDVGHYSCETAIEFSSLQSLLMLF